LLSNPPLLLPFSGFSIFVLINISLLFVFKTDNTFLELNNFYEFNNQIFALFLVFTIFVLIINRDFFSAFLFNKFEFDVLVCFVVIGSTCLCFADNFLQIYLAIELQSLCFYVLATFDRKSEYCVEAGLKYFIIGSVFSVILLFGLSFFYLTFGSNSFEFLNSLITSKNDIVLFLGLLFVLVVFLFKVGAAPFHI